MDAYDAIQSLADTWARLGPYAPAAAVEAAQRDVIAAAWEWPEENAGPYRRHRPDDDCWCMRGASRGRRSRRQAAITAEEPTE